MPVGRAHKGGQVEVVVVCGGFGWLGGFIHQSHIMFPQVLCPKMPGRVGNRGTEAGSAIKHLRTRKAIVDGATRH